MMPCTKGRESGCASDYERMQFPSPWVDMLKRCGRLSDRGVPVAEATFQQNMFHRAVIDDQQFRART